MNHDCRIIPHSSFSIRPFLPIILLVPVLTFIAVLLVSAILLTALLIVMLARTLLRPERMNDGKAILRLHRLSPGDLSLRFADVHFDVRDEQTGKPLHIAGWWIPADASSDQTILLLHGYSDAKVGSIAWAPLLHSL